MSVMVSGLKHVKRRGRLVDWSSKMKVEDAQKGRGQSGDVDADLRTNLS